MSCSVRIQENINQKKTPYLDTFSNNVEKIKQGQHLCRSITKISSAEIFQI